MTDDAGKKNTLPEGWLAVDALDIDAKGVARRTDGKVVFIEGALPGEWVSASVTRRKNTWEQASLIAIHRESSQRVRPRCPHFGLHEGACGGDGREYAAGKRGDDDLHESGQGGRG